MELIIKVPSFETGIEMETNLNRAIADLSEALKKKGLCEMDLEASDFDNDFKPIYKITIQYDK